MRSKKQAIFLVPYYAVLTCMLFACSGGGIGAANPTPTMSPIPATITQTPSATPGPTPMSSVTPEPKLPYGITIQTKAGLEKQPSKISVQWNSSLKELGSGEYILSFSECPEGGDCRQIDAFSLSTGDSTILARFNSSIHWDTALLQDHMIVALGEKFTAIQILDLTNRSDYSTLAESENEYLGKISRWDMVYLAPKTDKGIGFWSPKDNTYTVVNGIDFMLTDIRQNYLTSKVNDDEGCHPVLVQYEGMKIIPLKTSCDDPLLNWNFSPSGQWLWATGTDEQTLKSTVYFIPGKCLLEHPDDVEFCRQEKKGKFHFQSEYRCYRLVFLTKNEQEIIKGTSDSGEFCSYPGARLIGGDDKEIIIKSYPGILEEQWAMDGQMWTSDGRWVIWSDARAREWGLYSPYDGGQVLYLGKGLVFDFSIVQVP